MYTTTCIQQLCSPYRYAAMKVNLPSLYCNAVVSLTVPFYIEKNAILLNFSFGAVISVLCYHPPYLQFFCNHAIPLYFTLRCMLSFFKIAFFRACYFKSLYCNSAVFTCTVLNCQFVFCSY